MAPFKQHVAWTYAGQSRAEMRQVWICQMTVSQTVLGGMSLMMQTIKREGKTPDNKYVLLKAWPQSLTWGEKNNVMLKSWVDTDSLLVNSIT